MSSQVLSPYTVATLSTVTYSTILGALSRRSQNQESFRILIKAISAGHSILATSLAILALCQPWSIDLSPGRSGSWPKHKDINRLDDSRNPLISSKNILANFVTAWEAGYLIYDMGALFVESYLRNRSRGYRSALIRLLRTSPIFVIHHIVLATALSWLQTYIAAGREKGMKVVMAFLLMNASSPLLHIRWWRKKVTGQSSAGIDTVLALLFAASRFGSVYWVFSSYGRYHELNPWQAFRHQRLPCQAGTALLTALNTLWWLGLFRQMTQKKSRPTRT